jgi:hypothetical protein
MIWFGVFILINTPIDGVVQDYFRRDGEIYKETDK